MNKRLLIALILLGVFVIFILPGCTMSPNELMPERCTLPSGIACLDFTADSNQLQLRIQNSLGYSISIDSMKLIADNNEYVCVSEGSQEWEIANGQASDIQCMGSFKKGALDGQLDIRYTNLISQHSHQGQGVVYVKID